MRKRIIALTPSVPLRTISRLKRIFEIHDFVQESILEVLVAPPSRGVRDATKAAPFNAL
jgi:hypothetical protein